ncbi:lipocalin family protein [Gillisia limnaea]|uniref:Lipocalin-like domain-containing protein n=1 Tax=Gillisia limnaea (strain DSM 15749 / LMG 21470 / R-8282) TaxID=865937 RepID=H2BR83_GILLR|nr:lipocalin family protein [Gillisia limnaea]EHQ04402.1 hypothetical protein Gilli_0252 [Gillisia limnaea DSM 15749]
MKNLVLIILLTTLITSCNQQTPEEKLINLNGYWEIEKVEFSKDSIKQFRMSENVDYFEIKDGVGFRKKVRPQYDGTYIVTEDAEKIEARIENDSLNLYYATPFDSWKETVLKASEDKMSIRSNQGFIYHYKRFKSLLNELNEEEI